MEFKGTKGKWEVVKDDFYGSTLVKHNDFTICKLNVAHDDSITEANALLISKAPEMLEMLQRAKDKLYTVQSPSTSCRMLGDEIEKLIKEATEL